MCRIQNLDTGQYYKYCMKGVPRYGTKRNAFSEDIEVMTVVLKHLRIITPSVSLIIVEIK